MRACAVAGVGVEVGVGVSEGVVEGEGATVAVAVAVGVGVGEGDGVKVMVVLQTRSLVNEIEIAGAELEAGLGVLAAFVKSGLLASNGEARRQIKGGGLRVNDVAVTDEKMVLTGAHLTPERVIKLSLGKKRHVLLKPV